MRQKSIVSLLLVAGALILLTSPAWGFVNNGFETDYVYVSREASQGGYVGIYRESDGANLGNLLPNGSNWQSLTFAGKGNNDARLFLAKSVDSNGDSLLDDIVIAEVDAAGQTLKSINLSSKLGGPVGYKLDFGNIRYSGLHNTLFVATNTDATSDSPAMCWELDLGLTGIVHTYQGPGTVVDRRVNIDIDPAGNLYMTSRHLGGTLTLGDLISFDTAGRMVGGTTTTYTTLIDGPTYGAGDANWKEPTSPIWRGTNNPSGRPSLLVLQNWSSNWVPELEFHLDEVDGNGNLVKRGEPISGKRGWNGQLDEVSGVVWFASIRGGIMGLWPDDTTTYWEGSRYWVDMDSPAPEPTALALLSLGLIALRRRRARV